MNNSNINERTIAALEQLFEAATPEMLGKSLHQLLSFFLRESPHLGDKRSRQLIDDACSLIDFFHKID